MMNTNQVTKIYWDKSRHASLEAYEIAMWKVDKVFG